jgi:hypothetical protein
MAAGKTAPKGHHRAGEDHQHCDLKEEVNVEFVSFFHEVPRRKHEVPRRILSFNGM